VIDQNEQKVKFHSKRSDAIVKSILQHSSTSTGQKQLTNINSLAEEYLRLSYHGLRARNQSFNATLHNDFDTDIEEINIASQDLGRVFLNIFNNAFYAVYEKMKRSTAAGTSYEPMVTTITKKIKEGISINIIDNGDGIPKKLFDKIFQPFFTTKPAGEGTGLGLSLSYDIITKQLGGTINVKSEEGKGVEFMILLPLQ
jgi:signal transduction histidine kinase